MKGLYSITTLIITLLALASCVKEPSLSHEEIEQRSLQAWIKLHRPELLENYQEEGGYYVEVLNEGILDSVPVTGKDVWVWYDFTSRALSGNILETRSADVATQLNTYNKHTHYVPAFRFSGKDSHTLMEGTYLATFNKLKIGDSELEVRYGTELRLYLPSSVLSSDATTSDGGYEGEFAIDKTKPMIRIGVYADDADKETIGGVDHDARNVYIMGGVIDASGIASGVSIEGCKYPLKNHKLERRLQFAVSNELVGNCALISVRAGGVYIVESADPT